MIDFIARLDCEGLFIPKNFAADSVDVSCEEKQQDHFNMLKKLRKGHTWDISHFEWGG